RKALDGHTKAERPTVATIVERIGPMRNKTASAGDSGEGRRERRRSRA
ncbi:methionine synthase, partial [Mesorhizobium sp. M2A.F.Ca.ET.039.01.1.1]